MTRILITGASRGIGRRLAELALADGADLIATARNLDDLAGLGGRHLPLDVNDPSSIEAVAAGLDGTPVDILINNAGIFGPRGMSHGTIDFDAWGDVFQTNCIAPMRVSQALMPNLEAGSRKVIANISSRMASMEQSSGGEYIYRSSKAALNAAMRAMALDLADRGLTIAMLHPGWVRTDMGGSTATMSVDESARSLLATILALEPTKNGAFLNHDGATIGW